MLTIHARRIPASPLRSPVTLLLIGWLTVFAAACGGNAPAGPEIPDEPELPQTPETPEVPEEPLTKETTPNPPVDPNPLVDWSAWSIHDGKFWLDGEWTFLKTAKPLTSFASEDGCRKVAALLDSLQAKHYNAVSLNCYWNHFDLDGDGSIDVPLEPLRNLIEEIYARGMYPCLSVETYSVGGGRIPDGFWEKWPDAYAINDKGQAITDTQYGFGTKVVSIFHQGYRDAVHRYIRELANAVDTRKILYFETTVEPQYAGDQYLCYSESARREYALWLKEKGITNPDAAMPQGFPIPQEFIQYKTWNKFRAQFLARWVNEDAAAWRSVAGEHAYVAVDYLDGAESSMMARDGNPEEFLRALTCANIVQVNWHWDGGTRKPNQKAYDRVWKIRRETGRDWAVSEHMTMGGSAGALVYTEDELDQILENTLHQGTRFGWDFTNSFNRSADAFSQYNDDWSPKWGIHNVDGHWGWWMLRARQIEEEQR
ncbi:MAG: hypothetical protein IJ654_00705 [Bacteroidales bacterium]|nr:hypothetical protein [Bacteroidales bacterium]